MKPEGRAATGGEAVSLTPAAVQKSMLDKLAERIDWVHRRTWP